MKSKAALVARILLGLMFFVFGLNGFLNFLEQPEGTPEGEAFITALVDTGYLMTLIKMVLLMKYLKNIISSPKNSMVLVLVEVLNRNIF